MADLHPFLKPAADVAAQDATGKANAAKDDATSAVKDATAAVKTAQAAMTAAAATPSRIRTKRLPLSSLAVGKEQQLQVTWDTPFPTANYTVPTPGVVGATLLSLPIISNLTKEGCTITVKNAGLLALAANACTLHILAIHDPLT